ncbi:MAG: hypothetical protein RBT33_03540 [Candidatus Dojkabacteria bacterium]|jgi:hypothetical protein|nr:hypothetical protein [Candidatus Dojkabacteria bacterium]
MKYFKKKLKGFGLAELVLAIGIFAMISSTLLLLVIDSTRTIDNVRTKTNATYLVEEINSTILMLKNRSWFDVISHTGQGLKHFEYIAGEYQIVDGVGQKNGLNYSFSIEPVNRDISGILVSSGGSTDSHTRLVSISVDWLDKSGKLHTITPKLYINDWETNSIIQTTYADFSAGVHSDTLTVTNDDGEVRLRSVLYPDWCNPGLSINEYDIPGNANSRSVFARPGHAYLGTTGGSTGEPFTKLNIEGVDPPILTVEGTYSGHTVNDIFVTDSYAFLATATDNKEVIILDISSVPYTEVGYYDAPGSSDANSVYVDGNIGYVAQGRTVRSFNLSSYNGSRASIGSITIGWFISTVSKIAVQDGYMYAVLNWDWYELAIVNVSNPANMSITSQTSVNNQQVYDMYVSPDGTRVYFGTNSSSSENEFFILDTTQKSGSRPIIASVDMGGTTVRGIAVVEDGNVVILVGTGGTEYKVYVTEDEAHPEYCGGMEINNGIYDIDSNLDTQGNAFSYIITGDYTDEFKIIRGGPGGGGELGYGYVASGVYTSPALDSESADPRYYVANVVADIPSNTSIRVQFRASANSSMTGAIWMGPDGSASTYFTNEVGYNLPESLLGRYIQYRIEFSSDTINTPLVREVVIYYEK